VGVALAMGARHIMVQVDASAQCSQEQKRKFVKSSMNVSALGALSAAVGDATEWVEARLRLSAGGYGAAYGDR
jgi:hypothetical protein